MFCIIRNEVYEFTDGLPEDITEKEITERLDDEEYLIYSSDLTSFKIENGRFVRLKSKEEVLGERIRRHRETQCFPVINRGQLWYSKLTEMQKAELDAWYQAWLDAPQTLVEPETPAWLKE